MVKPLSSHVGSLSVWGFLSVTTTFDQFAQAFGAYVLAELETGGFVQAPHDADQRLRDAEEGLIRTRATTPAGVLGKIERVVEHLRDHRDTFGWLVDEVEDCERELVQPSANLRNVGEALAVASRRLDREEADAFFIRLLQSAANDCRQLAEAA